MREALIVGISGVTGLSRGRGAIPPGCASLTADLTDAQAVQQTLGDIKPDAVFLASGRARRRKKRIFASTARW